MLDSFNETLRDELDYAGVDSCEQTEPFDFSALNTFDSEDCREGLTRAEIGIAMPKISCESDLRPDGGVDSTGQDYSTHCHNQSIECPLSAKSINDSFVEEQTNGKGIHSSIFRPRTIAENAYSQRTHAQRNYYNAPEESGTVHQSKRMRISPHSQFTPQEKAMCKSLRQVSVTDSRTMSARQSFDSFGDKTHMRNLSSANSMAYRGKSGKSTGVIAIERHQDKSDEKEREGVGYYEHARRRNHRSNNRPVSSVSKRGNCQSPGLVTPMRSRSSKTANYHMILGSRAKIFKDFTFLLPDLKMYVMDYLSSKEHQWENGGLSYEDLVAQRRLVCAVQAYGGNIFPRPAKVQQSSVSSIFRSNAEDLATTEWNNDRYEQHLSLRYYENNGHLSWDVEENPPVAGDSSSTLRLLDSDQSKVSVSKDAEDKSKMSREELQDSNGEVNEIVEEVKSDSGETPKMRYRCKLCGQPKQNHMCSFQQALERSIGTMSYAAVNAFEAKETGKLAPSLSEMNNFVDLEDEDEDGSIILIDIGAPSKCAIEESVPFAQSASNSYIGRRRKRRKSDSGKSEKYRGDERLFHKNMEIKQEQCRQVSMRASCRMGDFKYPTLPLTFHQRKKASEDLFKLCQGLSGLADECAKILRVARESDNWDLAIAEMTTQMLVIIHCPPSDDTLEGVKQHLMTMGISC